MSMYVSMLAPIANQFSLFVFCWQQWFCQSTREGYGSREECLVNCPDCSDRRLTFRTKSGSLKPSCRGLPLIKWKKAVTLEEMENPQPENAYVIYTRVCMLLFEQLPVAKGLLMPGAAFFNAQLDAERWKEMQNAAKDTGAAAQRTEPTPNEVLQGLNCKTVNSTTPMSGAQLARLRPFLKRPLPETDSYWEEWKKCAFYEGGQIRQGSVVKYTKLAYVKSESAKSSEVRLLKLLPFQCFNPFRTQWREEDHKCQRVAVSTNGTMLTEATQVADGSKLLQWPLLFNVFMRFSKYWASRSVANKKYAAINYFPLGEVLRNATGHESMAEAFDAVKNEGIVILGYFQFDCGLLTDFCDYKVSWHRVDDKFPGFGVSRNIYTPRQSLWLSSIQTQESRTIEWMKGIRVVVAVDSKMHVFDPITFLIAVGTLAGLLGIAKTMADLMVARGMKQKNNIEPTYEQFVEFEKAQINRCFLRALAEEMQVLYQKQQRIKQLFTD